MNRDKRWESVEAYVGPPQGYIYEEPDSPVDVTKFTQFRIEVRDDKNVWYYNIIVENRDLEEPRLRIFQFTLDKMVEQIDYYMENTGRSMPSTP